MVNKVINLTENDIKNGVKTDKSGKIILTLKEKVVDKIKLTFKKDGG